MTLFDFMERHPWWSLVYLMVAANWFGGLVVGLIQRHREEKKKPF